ncbi:unnamed protein product [Triticum turgidum subsp. durum]|uniref:Uncharacterized protein n=1 Tax=Triticum turgidum subsp. durum TaxID=4567 RepID=A0A9R0VQW2_TRITD|nr:unnamed protein product [Triticum turgidum subsp. durum]
MRVQSTQRLLQGYFACKLKRGIAVLSGSMWKDLFTSFALLPLECRCWRNEIAVRERVQAARTPVVLGDRRKEGLEQPYDVHAFGTRKALLLMPISSPAIGYERVVKAAACKVQQGNFNKRVVG